MGVIGLILEVTAKVQVPHYEQQLLHHTVIVINFYLKIVIIAAVKALHTYGTRTLNEINANTHIHSVLNKGSVDLVFVKLAATSHSRFKLFSCQGDGFICYHMTWNLVWIK